MEVRTVRRLWFLQALAYTNAVFVRYTGFQYADFHIVSALPPQGASARTVVVRSPDTFSHALELFITCRTVCT